MVSYPSPVSVQFNTFKGIRTRNGLASGGVISAVECKNVDFKPSSYDAGVNIATSLGNIEVCAYSSVNDLYAYKYENHLIYTKSTTITSSTVLYDENGNVNADDTWSVELEDESYVIKYDDEIASYSKNDDIYEYTIVKGFEFKSDAGSHLLFYVENASKGILAEYKNNAFTTIFDNLDRTTKANGITMIDNAYNTFVFTNGVNYVAWTPDGSTTTQTLSPQYIDEDNNTVTMTGLALAELDGSLIIGGDNGTVLASKRGDITDYDVTGGLDTSAWYETFGKPITAIVSMTGGLIVFTDEDNTVLSGYNTIATRTRKDSNLGGCLSCDSWVKHDKYLFFYDNNQKNIYYYAQNDYGQMVLGTPIAPEVQKFFSNINKLQMVSYIGKNRSEIWILTDENKLLFDYFVEEWSERYCQELNGYFVYDNDVYSIGNKKCFREKVGSYGVFDGDFYGSKYKTQIINLGTFSNMKEMEFQPLLSVETDHNNTFYIDCQIDGKKVKSKYVKMFYNGAVWGDDADGDDDTPENELWAGDEPNSVGQVFPKENDIIQQVKGKFISNWYYIQFTFRTVEKSDDFSISAMELKGITQETDTTGRK